MKPVTHILYYTVLVLTLAACTREQVPEYGDGDRQRVIITLSTAQTRSGTMLFDDKDFEIKELRVMGYTQDNGTLAFNEYIGSFDQVSDPNTADVVREASVTVLTGTFDFVFVANESSDPMLNLGDVNIVGTMDKLKEVAFSDGAFARDKGIPMMNMYKGVRVVEDNKVWHNSVMYAGSWDIEMERLAIRVEMSLDVPESLASAAATLRFENVPDKVYLFQKENTGAGKTVSFGTAANVSSPVGGVVTMTWTRMILPECWFDDPSDDDKAVVICYSNSGEDKKGILGTEPSQNDYTLPRNCYYDITGTVQDDGTELDITLDVLPWVLNEPDGPGEIELHVSAVTASVNERNMARIYFSSNQPRDKLYIESKTAEDVDVDNIFYGLTGASPENFHYEYNASTGSGSGYFDFITDHLLPGFETDEHKIYLAAGKLQREIIISVEKVGDQLSKYSNYVGAFWRAQETGERVIAMQNTGDWTATVDHSGSEAPGDWVVLAPGKSLDPDFWSENPGNPESFPVEGKETTISGSGNIYFRIGLTGINTDYDIDYKGIKPRYALVKITTTSGTKTLYLRQGETEDYVMRPTDPSTGNFVSSTRPYAVRYTPYNLTSSEYPDIKTCLGDYTTFSQIGSRATGNRYATFTDYPTQAGAYFNWIDQGETVRYSWFYTGSTITEGRYSPDVDTDNLYWNTLGKENETCPIGYRRPNDGSITGLSAVETDVSESEQRQSLWLTPPVKFAGYNDNHLAGYYADGYFDRLKIVDALGDMYAAPYSTVKAGDYRVAYIGRVYYNPHNNASLFFPHAGYSTTANAYMDGAGTYGLYWSSSHSHVRTGMPLEQFNAWAMGTYMGSNSHYNRSIRTSIRCVVDDRDPERNEWYNRFARSNIIYKDGKLIFAVTEEDNDEIPANAVGMMFKFGSLIGVNTDTRDDDKTFVPWDLDQTNLFVPAEHNKIYTSHDPIPIFENVKLVDENGADIEDEFLYAYPGDGGTTVGYDASAGLGDICRYISDKGWVEGRWRLPHTSDIEELYENNYNVSCVINGGVWERVSVKNIDGVPGTAPINNGWWINTDTPASLTKPPKGVVFLPANGYYNSSGQYLSYGTVGTYWATSHDKIDKWGSCIHVQNVYSPRWGATDRRQTKGVRCIREIEY